MYIWVLSIKAIIKETPPIELGSKPTQGILKGPVLMLTKCREATDCSQMHQTTHHHSKEYRSFVSGHNMKKSVTLNFPTTSQAPSFYNTMSWSVTNRL